MRKNLVLMGTLCLVVCLYACQKEKHGHLAKQITIDTTLQSGTDFALNLKPYGDADDTAYINKQATSYAVSAITQGSGIFDPVYHYSANTKTAIYDQVILKIAEGNSMYSRNAHNNDTTTITINFTVQ